MNWNEFDMKLKSLKTKSIKHFQKISNSCMIGNLPRTDDSFKYKMNRLNDQTYVSPVIIAKILAVVDINGNIVTESDIKEHGFMVSLVLDKTCFYCTAGGQQNDVGTVKTESGIIFDIIDVEKIQENGVILHYIKSSDWPKLLRYLYFYHLLFSMRTINVY